MTTRSRGIGNSRESKSAATYSPKPEIADGEPPDVEFPRLAAAQHKAADHQSADRESGKRKKAAGESARGYGAERERPLPSARTFRGGPDGAFLLVVVQNLMH
jgi:hypothetical protein